MTIQQIADQFGAWANPSFSSRPKGSYTFRIADTTRHATFAPAGGDLWVIVEEMDPQFGTATIRPHRTAGWTIEELAVEAASRYRKNVRG